MSSSQTPSPERPDLRPDLRPGRIIKRALPRGLLGRSLIIIVAPMFILMCIVS
jgi:two-component system osmolarity sensor histidine kinase EnvZ